MSVVHNPSKHLDGADKNSDPHLGAPVAGGPIVTLRSFVPGMFPDGEGHDHRLFGCPDCDVMAQVRHNIIRMLIASYFVPSRALTSNSKFLPETRSPRNSNSSIKSKTSHLRKPLSPKSCDKSSRIDGRNKLLPSPLMSMMRSGC
jgi:hypothetical protein